MPSLVELSQAIASYRSGRISIDAFEDWFRDHSRGMFGESADVLNVCLAIESAFSSIRFGDATEEQFGVELANAMLPFEGIQVDYFALSDSGVVLHFQVETPTTGSAVSSAVSETLNPKGERPLRLPFEGGASATFSIHERDLYLAA